MKTRAAVAYAAGKPLEVVTVDLDGPRAGEVLVEIKATGICHTDEFTRTLIRIQRRAATQGLSRAAVGAVAILRCVSLAPRSMAGFSRQ